MRTLTMRQLIKALNGLRAKGADLDMEVIVRVQNDDDCIVGGLTTAEVDPGCSEVDALVLDGNQDAVSRCIACGGIGRMPYNIGWESCGKCGGTGLVGTGPSTHTKAGEFTVPIDSDLAGAIDKYMATDWSNGRDPSKIGALNAVAYIGERLVGIYARAKKER